MDDNLYETRNVALQDVQVGDYVELLYSQYTGQDTAWEKTQHWLEGKVWSDRVDSRNFFRVGANAFASQKHDGTVELMPRYELVSLVRQIPIPVVPTKPGTLFTATVRGVENVTLVVVDIDSGAAVLPTCYMTVHGAVKYKLPPGITTIQEFWFNAANIDAASVKVLYEPGNQYTREGDSE